MCGISGLIGQSGQCVSDDELQSLNSLLQHRGPDGQGIWLSSCRRVGLGHTRLSILDLSNAASQPMLSDDGGHCIVFNGEIYNFVELARELSDKGVSFHTRSDTEVLLEGYRHWGDTLWNRLNGMWAVAIHDVRTGETVLCRDRFGVKPLYFLQRPTEPLIFASEASAIDRFLSGSLAPDSDYLLRLGHADTDDRSCLVGVSSLRAGELLRISIDGELRREVWYRMSVVDCPTTLPEQARHFHDLLVDACRIRLRSDVPVATCLSGGVDSGSIIAVLNQVSDSESRFAGFNHRSFNAAFPGTPQDENKAARNLAHSCGVSLDSHVVECPTAEELESALRACDGPMPCMAFYPIWHLYRHIRRQGIVVTLDGMGPDEYLGGYYIGRAALQGAWESGSPIWMRDVWQTYASLYEDGHNRVQADAWQVGRTVLSKIKRRLMFRHPLPAYGAHFSGGASALSLDEAGLLSNSLARFLYYQIAACPLPYLLHQYDRCSMASGVESRFPFMDFRLVEYAFSLPLQSRVGGGYTKRILREAVAGVLPDSIRLNKRKTGFNSPFAEWLKGPLRNWVGDLAASESFRQSSFFDGHRLSTSILNSLDGHGAMLQEWDVWMPLHMTWWLNHKRSVA